MKMNMKTPARPVHDYPHRGTNTLERDTNTDRHILLGFGIAFVLVIITTGSIVVLHHGCLAMQTELQHLKADIQSLEQSLGMLMNEYELMDKEDDEVEWDDDEEEDGLYAYLDNDWKQEEDVDNEKEEVDNDDKTTDITNHLELDISDLGRPNIASPILARLRRNADTDGQNHEVPEKRKKKSDKKKKNKNKNRRRHQKEETEAVHLIPIDYTQERNSMEEGDEVTTNCGTLQYHGLQVHCEVSTFWRIDTTIQSTTYDPRHRPLADLVNGVLVVHKPGLYYIYSQMTHHDQLGSWSYGVNRTRGIEKKMLMQCPGMEPHYHSSAKTNKVYPVQFQCHTSMAVRLEKDDQLSIFNQYYFHRNRVVKLERELTFWGLIRLGP